MQEQLAQASLVANNNTPAWDQTSSAQPHLFPPPQSSLKRGNDYLDADYTSQGLYSMTSNPAKRRALTDETPILAGEGQQNSASVAETSTLGLPRLVLGPGGVEAVPLGGNAPSNRSSLRSLNSYASGLSPARLLCQAIQQSASAGIRGRDRKGHSSSRSTGSWKPARLQEEQGIASSSNLEAAARPDDNHDPNSEASRTSEAVKVKQEQEDISASENPDRQDSASNVDTSRSSSPPTGSSSASDGKKNNSPFDDADPMQYAKTTETSDITVPGPEQLSKAPPLPAPFPPLPTARKLVDAYFERVNPQLPILDRATFMPRFEAACRDGLARAKSAIVAQAKADGKEPRPLNDDEVEIKLHPADGHLFHLVLAIAAAMGWTRSNWSAENHHEAAMRYLDPRRGGVGAIMGRDSLEQLQCLLLTALYSIMRTMKPGVWYCLGVALRLTTGLGLYSESSGALENSNSSGSQLGQTEFLAEKKRRLFWCAYALDRQVCVHLGRPFGISDPDVKVDLPWIADESEMIQPDSAPHSTRTRTMSRNDEDEAIGEDTLSSSGFDERLSDTSHDRKRKEAASTLAALGETADASFPRPKDASRWVSLSFFRMRILQSEIQGLLYQNGELPRRFSTFEHWKSDMLARLASWRRYAPSDKQELEKAGCGYNPVFLELNFQQTLLMIYGMNPRFPTPTRDDLAHVENCSRTIISIYAELAKGGQLNYTWMTGHNIFIACTSYLYAIWQISATTPASIRSSMSPGFQTKAEEIDHFGKACDKVLASLNWSTAEKCRKCVKTMFTATMGVVEKLDRMIAARALVPGFREGGSEQQCKLQTSSGLVDSRERRWAPPHRPDSPGGWESARTSDMRSYTGARSPAEAQPAGISARSLYTQEGPNRYQPSSGRQGKGSAMGAPAVPGWPSEGGGIGSPPGSMGSGAYLNRTQQLGRPFQLSPKVPHLVASPSQSGGNGNGRYRSEADWSNTEMGAEPPSFAQAYMPRGGAHDPRSTWAAGSPNFGSRGAPGGFGRNHGSPWGQSYQRFSQASPDSHAASILAGTGTTPSSGLELEGSAGMSPSALLRTGVGASPSGISGEPLSGGSPSNLDLSSLMATSAMELDQLFREAGLRIGHEAGLGMSTNSTGQGSDSMGLIGGGQFGTSGDMATARDIGDEHNGANAGLLRQGAAGIGTSNGMMGTNLGGAGAGAGVMSWDDGLESDWEALGFGFRMNASHGNGEQARAGQGDMSSGEGGGGGARFMFDFRHQLDSGAGGF